jgi:hypothetical protein
MKLAMALLALATTITGCDPGNVKTPVCATPTPTSAPKLQPRHCYSDGTTLSERNPQIIVARIEDKYYIYFYIIPKGYILTEESVPMWMLETWYTKEVKCLLSKSDRGFE